MPRIGVGAGLFVVFLTLIGGITPAVSQGEPQPVYEFVVEQPRPAEPSIELYVYTAWRWLQREWTLLERQLRGLDSLVVGSALGVMALLAAALLRRGVRAKREAETLRAATASENSLQLKQAEAARRSAAEQLSQAKAIRADAAEKLAKAQALRQDAERKLKQAEALAGQAVDPAKQPAPDDKSTIDRAMEKKEIAQAMTALRSNAPASTRDSAMLSSVPNTPFRFR